MNPEKGRARTSSCTRNSPSQTSSVEYAWHKCSLFQHTFALNSSEPITNLQLDFFDQLLLRFQGCFSSYKFPKWNFWRRAGTSRSSQHPRQRGITFINWHMKGLADSKPKTCTPHHSQQQPEALGALGLPQSQWCYSGLLKQVKGWTASSTSYSCRIPQNPKSHPISRHCKPHRGTQWPTPAPVTVKKKSEFLVLQNRWRFYALRLPVTSKTTSLM